MSHFFVYVLIYSSKFLNRLVDMNKEMREKTFCSMGFFITMLLLRRMEDSLVLFMRQFLRSKPTDALIYLITITVLFYLAINSHLIHLVKHFRDSNEKRNTIYRFIACLLLLFTIFVCFDKFSNLSARNSTRSQIDPKKPFEIEKLSNKSTYLNQTQTIKAMFENQSFALIHSNQLSLPVDVCIDTKSNQFCPANYSDSNDFNSYSFKRGNLFETSLSAKSVPDEPVDKHLINTSNTSKSWETIEDFYQISTLKKALFIIIIGFLTWSLVCILRKIDHSKTVKPRENSKRRKNYKNLLNSFKSIF